MTQLESARAGQVTVEMAAAAEREPISPERMRELVARGHVVIPRNRHHQGCRPTGIGRELAVKVNANIGTSRDRCDLDSELQKVAICREAGADTLMDLSTGGDLNHIRRTILDGCELPLGTVPVYQVMVEHEDVRQVSAADILDTVRLHAEQGVDFVTVHCGVAREAIPLLERRLTGVVSRGGAFLVSWMRAHERENPLLSHYDELLQVAREHDVTLSLGDGLRPGCLADATDEAQLHELRVLGTLVHRAREAGVQVMVEGPGHVPLSDVPRNMQLQAEICDGAPFYVLGPLVTDVAAGYDHIAGAIGGAVAAMHGAAFLCYVTPAEHLKLPEPDEVREGIMASRIAAHAADVARGLPGAREWDDRMSAARVALDWEGQLQQAMDPPRARELRAQSGAGESHETCTMCGPFCAIKVHRREHVKRTRQAAAGGGAEGAEP
jgi:phosphomethylpyrimidine synthase